MKHFQRVCLAMLLAAILALPVFAAGGSVTLTSPAGDLQPGDTFTVEAVLENSTAVALGTVALDYDETVFTLAGGTCQVENAMFSEVLINEKAGTFFLLLPKKVSGTVFTFQFRVNTNATAGTYAISGEAALGDESGDSIPVKELRVNVSNPQAPTQAPEETAPPTQEPQPPATQPVSPTEPDAEPTVEAPSTVPTEEASTVPSTQTPATQPSATAPTSQPSVENPPKKDGGSWWILAVVLLAGAAGLIIWKKKK